MDCVLAANSAASGSNLGSWYITSGVSSSTAHHLSRGQWKKAFNVDWIHLVQANCTIVLQKNTNDTLAFQWTRLARFKELPFFNFFVNLIHFLSKFCQKFAPEASFGEFHASKIFRPRTKLVLSTKIFNVLYLMSVCLSQTAAIDSNFSKDKRT